MLSEALTSKDKAGDAKSGNERSSVGRFGGVEFGRDKAGVVRHSAPWSGNDGKVKRGRDKDKAGEVKRGSCLSSTAWIRTRQAEQCMDLRRVAWTR